MPTKEDVAQRIESIFVNDFGVKKNAIRPTARLYQDLGLDSIDAIDLVVKLEMETKLRLKAPDLRSIKTFQDVVDIVTDRLKNQNLKNEVKS